MEQIEKTTENALYFLLNKIRHNYKQRLKRKTNWGKNEVYIEFEQAFTEAILETASRFEIDMGD